MVAHDGFPEAQPFATKRFENEWLRTLLTTAEYMVIVETYFPKGRDGKRITVPKKITKAVYAPGFFRHILGDDAEYVVTVRNPLACCVSSYEKSGGLPANGKFIARSAIERWVRREVHTTHVSAEPSGAASYIETYMQYWEQFHIRLALGGLLVGRRFSIVPYGAESMEATALTFAKRFSADATDPPQFKVHDSACSRHPEWVDRAAQALDRVGSTWRLVGLPFPRAELDLGL